jgi:CRP/FNR family transcriptional regulator, cyclic AMP receptor protein
MDASGFFDYPEDKQISSQQVLIFLPELDEGNWSLILSFTQQRAFTAKEDVLHIGDTGRALYIVARGNLEVVIPQKRGRELRIAKLGEGSVFGEQAFLDGQARSATVRAITDGRMNVLSLDSFEILAAHHPDLARIMLMDLGRILALRLRQAMTMVAGGL